MTDERRAYTLKCLCGFTREKHIGRPPAKCPQCGAKPEPDGLNRAMRRKLAREMKRRKVTPEIVEAVRQVDQQLKQYPDGVPFSPDLEPGNAA
jgi:hypothetical protein